MGIKKNIGPDMACSLCDDPITIGDEFDFGRAHDGSTNAGLGVAHTKCCDKADAELQEPVVFGASS